VTLRRFGVWRWAVAAVAGAALAGVAVWAMAALAAAPADGALPVLVTALGLGGATLVAAISLARVEAGVLACRDGRPTFAPDRSHHEPLRGELAGALDLGPFLLLTLAGHGARARRWLPEQRVGLEGDWHARRHAVYSPPLAAAETLAAYETSR